MTSVVIDNVTKQYGNTAPSVDKLNLHIEDGEFFTLLGPSGCGKSTTLRMVAGFITPTSGTIRFGEKDITRMPPHKRDTGMVFQNYALFPHMSVQDNVGYGLKMRRVAKPEARKRVLGALEIVGLEHLAQRRIEQLSGGQQQRVALARALVISPEVLLLDEPLSNLDAKLREETRAHIRSLQQASGTTSLYVTHDQAEAMSMSDRIAVLSAGQLHQVGTPREIYQRPATEFVARFIGRSNVLPGVLEGTDAGTSTIRLDVDGSLLRVPSAGNAVLDAAATGDAVSVSVRPEDFALSSLEPGTAGTLSGRVLAVEYTGAQCTLSVAHGDSTILATLPDAAGMPHPGDDVVLSHTVERAWAVAP